MKLIHTSDWHLGQNFYSYDRTDEYIHFFDQLKRIAIHHNPDALLVSGDIFDVSSPSTSIMKLFTDYILNLHDAVPNMSIIITSGNHDSASRIDVNRNLWGKAGIHVIGNVPRKNGEYDFSQNLITIPGKGIIIPIPYINRAYMASQENNKNQEQCFFGKAADFISNVNNRNLPCILMAHLTVEGCDMTGHRIAEIGNINSVKSDIFDMTFDYVALGHIHHAQNLDRSGRIRYSGTPLAVSFDEDYPHSISIVNIEKGEKPVINEVEISPLRKLKTFPETADEFKKAIKQLKKLPDNDNSYIRLNIAQESDLPADCQEIASSATAGKDCRFCMIKYLKINERNKEYDSIDINVAEFAELTPIEVAGRFFNSLGISEKQSECYLKLLSKIQDDHIIDNTL